MGLPTFKAWSPVYPKPAIKIVRDTIVGLAVRTAKRKRKKPAAKKATKKKSRKRKSKVRESTTVLTIRELKAKGWHAAKVEYWLAFGRGGGVRKDLYGCIDVVAVNEKLRATIGVQCTSRENVGSRIEKIRLMVSDKKNLDGAAIRTWLRIGNRLEVWGWDKWDKLPRILVVRLGLSVAGSVKETGREDITAERIE
jgi:hypothetical protein